MTGYLQDGETYESRLLDLLTEVRRAPQDELRTRRFQEVMALTAVMQSTGLGALSSPTVNVFRGDERGLDTDVDPDDQSITYLIGVLDASYGGEAPAAIRANFLYHLTGEGREVEVTGAEFQVQADDPDDKLEWADLDAIDARLDRTEDDPSIDARLHPEPSSLLAAPARPAGSEGIDLDEDNEPEPISAAERLRQKTKKKGK